MKVQLPEKNNDNDNNDDNNKKNHLPRRGGPVTGVKLIFAAKDKQHEIIKI